MVALVQGLERGLGTGPSRGTDFAVSTSDEAAHALRRVPLALWELGRICLPAWVLAWQSRPSSVREAIVLIPLQVRDSRYVAAFAVSIIILLFWS